MTTTILSIVDEQSTNETFLSDIITYIDDCFPEEKGKEISRKTLEEIVTEIKKANHPEIAVMLLDYQTVLSQLTDKISLSDIITYIDNYLTKE
ncbi:MAG: hypothetical protein KGV46_02330 [Pasteurella sp.]|nr:hypothetical protein [Pasteurella sp.]